MELIDQTYTMGTRHPQELVTALYELVINPALAGYGGPDDEVDVFVAILNNEPNDEGVSRSVTVKGALVSRVGRQLLLHPDTGEDAPDPHILNFQAGHQWAVAVEGADGYMFIHRHHEGFPEPGGKDYSTSDILASIDYADGRVEQRRFNLMAVVNTDASTPIRPGRLIRTGLTAVDGRVAIRLAEEFSDEMREKLAETTFFVHMAEVQNLLDAIDSGERRDDEPLRDEFEAILKLANEAGEGILPAGAVGGGGDISDIGRMIEDMLRQMGIDITQVEGSPFDDVEPLGLGYDVPPIQMVDPDAPRAKPSNIFDVPDIDKIDDPEVRWN